jgi:hypothetical protein
MSQAMYLRPVYKRRCKWGNHPFNALRADADYCCHAHRQAAYRRRQADINQQLLTYRETHARTFNGRRFIPYCYMDKDERGSPKTIIHRQNADKKPLWVGDDGQLYTIG